jgi:hypothetical protein
MAQEWQELTRMTGGNEIVVERVRLIQTDIAIEGKFDLPPLARLSAEDQVFVAAFVRSHGSIKQMESLFGVSYPTIKNRLNRIAGQFDFDGIQAEPAATDVLERLSSGELSVEEALKQLKGRR